MFGEPTVLEERAAVTCLGTLSLCYTEQGLRVLLWYRKECITVPYLIHGLLDE
jgi:hypothetical protein